MTRRTRLCLSIVTILSALGSASIQEPPGVVINYIPSQMQIHIGSPGNAVLPNGPWLAQRDQSGPMSSMESEE